jgi:hypothetical protein
MARQLNAAGSRNAASKIASGDYDDSSSWSFGAEDGDKLLGANGDDWAEYARWFLGENTDAEPKAKARYSYPFGKGGKVYSSALRAIRSRASQQGDTSIFDRAGALLDAAGADDKSFAKEIDDAIMRRAYSDPSRQRTKGRRADNPRRRNDSVSGSSRRYNRAAWG